MGFSSPLGRCELKRVGDEVWKWNKDERSRSWEVRALGEVKGLPGMQELLGVEGEWVITRYAGEPGVEVEDREGQGWGILQSLRQRGMVHRDIMPSNILVLDGRLTLIDFEWCEIRGTSLGTPQGLGGRWVCPDGFDDRYSLWKVLGL